MSRWKQISRSEHGAGDVGRVVLAALTCCGALLPGAVCVHATPTHPPEPTPTLTQQAQALFFPEGASQAATGASATTTLNHLKSLQGRDVSGLGEIGAFLERPVWLPEVRVSDHFRIHFTSEAEHAPAGWPGSQEFLDTAALACEAAWEEYHTRQRWPVPPSLEADYADTLVHVYVMDLGWGVYGYALHEDLERCDGHAGFIVVDNDFVGFQVEDPLEALAGTIAHEYHHVVQFGFGYDPDASWFMEQTATMEASTVAWRPDELRPYLAAYGSHTYRRLDLCNGFFEYGACLWPLFLAERWNQASLISIWETWAGGAVPVLDATRAVLEQVDARDAYPLPKVFSSGTLLDAALLEWMTWNVLLGRSARLVRGPYDRASELPAVVTPEFTIDSYPAVGLRPDPNRQPEPLGASVILLRPQSGSADKTLEIEVSCGSGFAGVRLVVAAAAGGGVTVIDGTGEAELCKLEVPNWHQAAEAWLIVLNGSASPAATGFAVSARTRLDRGSASVDPDAEALDMLLMRAEPNPFELRTVIRYELARDSHIRLRIFDMQGRVVASLWDGRASAGPHGIYWRGALTGGARASAGIYLARLESEIGTREIRLLCVR